MRRKGSKTSPSASEQCEPSMAAKQTVLRKSGKGKLALCGVPLGGVKIYNKGEAAEEKQVSFKNPAEA